MQVIRARKMGFCFGVRRAYEKISQLAQEQDERPLVMAGELVHNSSVIGRVAALGVAVVNEVGTISNSRAVIRTHGTTRENFEHLVQQNTEVHDSTCVIVKDAREAALDLLERHPVVIVVGKKQHPEVVGLVSWLDGRYHVVETPEDIEQLAHYASVGVVSQTTFYPERFSSYCARLAEIYPQVEVKDTICPHTSKNQETSIHTARVVDVMLVVGDGHSSNSRTLYNEVLQVNPQSYFIQSAADISDEWFDGIDPSQKPALSDAELQKGNAGPDFRREELSVGITAGASTPDWLIDEIEQRLLKQTQQ